MATVNDPIDVQIRQICRQQAYAIDGGGQDKYLPDDGDLEMIIYL